MVPGKSLIDNINNILHELILISEIEKYAPLYMYSYYSLFIFSKFCESNYMTSVINQYTYIVCNTCATCNNNLFQTVIDLYFKK